jgi:hypothetical protein
MSDAVELKAAIEILRDCVAKLAESEARVCSALSRDFNINVQTKREIGQVMEFLDAEGPLNDRLAQVNAHLGKVR